ncbi:ComEC/Rec2 family competence protein [Actinomyces culturomici]|uniref:ComEC/Rec2 family competence protein n=1 Tax=Actinomyces culturomici TaxID=1926276 RepID=UPI00135C433A|nr:ComEC/Rec2 family competence protein [Actinomyces culturomici]
MSDWRLVPAALAAWGATLLATGLDAGHPLVLAVAAGLVVAAGLLLVSLRRARPRGGRHSLTPGGLVRGAALLGVAAALAGIAVGSAHRSVLEGTRAARAAAEGVLITLDARLDGDPTPVDGRFGGGGEAVATTVLSAGRAALAPSAPIGVRLQGTGWPRLHRGDVVEVRGLIDPSFPGALPVAGTMRVRALRLVERPGGWRGAVRTLRSALVEVCADLSDQGRALVPGMAIGDDRAMGRELEDAFRATSLSHLTAVSGSHMAIVLGVVPLLVPGARRARSIALVLVLLAFLAVVGPSPPVLRAAATSGAGIGAATLGRNSQGLATLSTVVLSMLLLDPWASRDFGFALSAAATFGVVAPARAGSRWGRAHLRDDTRAGRLAKRSLDALLVPTWCSVLAAPILLLVDPRLPVYAIPANLLAAPAVAPATLLGLAAALLAPVLPGAAVHVASWAQIPTAWIAAVAEGFAGLPGARMETRAEWIGALALVLVALLRRRIRRRLRR